MTSVLWPLFILRASPMIKLRPLRPALRSSPRKALAVTQASGDENGTSANVTRTRSWADVVASTKLIPLGIVSLLLVAIAGCQAVRTAPTVDAPAATAGLMTLEDFATALSDPDLVEVYFRSGCSRCDATRGPIGCLASDRRGGLSIRRVDLRQHPQLWWDFKLNACPSYVAFRSVQEVLRAEHQTSTDFIENQLDESFGNLAHEPLAALTR